MPLVYVAEFDNGFQLIRNGKPFKIKGAAGSPEFLQELKDAGGNTLRIYDTINLKAILDRAWALDIAVVVDIPLPSYYYFPEYYENEQIFLEMQDKVEEIVIKHKDHPALLYWNLGNEIHYPNFHRRTKFFQNYHSLIDRIHEIDYNHPVSTTFPGAQRKTMISIALRRPKLDFVSINIFGEISTLHERIESDKFIWEGLHLISEWGVNGPWEAKLTSWNAPIEETSTKKAEQIRERSYDYIVPLKSNNSLGSFIFFWGQKNEHTPTWFSLIRSDKKKSQAVFELSNIWKNTSIKYDGPILDFILLNQKGAQSNVILKPNSIAEVEIFFPDNTDPNYKIECELRHESWYDIEKSINIQNIAFEIKGKKINFITPYQEGPYRLFVFLTNDSDYFATANIPFYVLNPRNEE